MGVKRGILGREGTFASARSAGCSEQKGVAAVAECEGGIPTDVRCGNGNRAAGNAATLRVRQVQDGTGGVATRGARICELTVAEELVVIGGLRAMVRGLVEDFNRAAGEAVLYFSECLNMWALFALRGKDKCDKCVATGYSTVDGLAALVMRLQKGEVAV